MDTVMQAIREYGIGHTPTSASTAVPDSSISEDPNNPADSYEAAMGAIFSQGDFPRLEREAQTIRLHKSRLTGGFWKLISFYDGVSRPPAGRGAPDADYQAILTSLKKWISTYPESATPRIALADFYLNYAQVARGTGYANTVSDSAWDLHAQRTELALQSLLEAAKLKEKCPYWYEAMQIVAINQGWGKSQARPCRPS